MIDEKTVTKIDQTIVTLCDYIQNKIESKEIDLDENLSPLVTSLATLIQSRNSCC
ncbi:hypothetical protein J2TS6_54810 [Paenibacillus albilobatus]|uniref:Uncharacterized protein n=1 Tax=Paenibacillus albilobatus TaxID=2716884 RepID=A0A919XPY4_9BACL|nr:hypothetical protein J2TS6_54810 [Paenibacillus albilobatus]